MSENSYLPDHENIFSIDQLLEACAENGASMELSEIGVDSNDTSGDETANASQKKSVEIARSVLTVQNGIPERINSQGQSDQAHIVDSYHEYSPGPARKKKMETWLRSQNKKKRMHGENYVGFSVQLTLKGRRTTPQNQIRNARQIGPPCVSRLCSNRKTRHCNQFTHENRLNLFDHFWKHMSWEEKRAYVLSLVDQKPPNKRVVQEGNKFRKEETYVYFLKLEGIKKQVCRNMFLNTLGIGRSHLRGWLRTPIKLPKLVPRVKNGGDTTYAVQFLVELPKLPSHYCRKNTGKLFLEPIIRSKTHLYGLYKERCLQENKEKLSSWKFFKLFEENRLSVHQPKKDQCDLCSAHQVGQLSEVEYRIHLANKNKARDEKEMDKSRALNGLCHVITMDLQSVLLSPVLNASALYYKTKLIVHNFTMYNLESKQVECFLWDETQAELVASTFATCVIKFLDQHFNQDSLPIIIYSDGCTNQNRNAVLSNALGTYAVERGKTIYQKYLEKGHTQMEVDSVHAMIEKRLKNQFIYHPYDYVEICKTARAAPYNVQYLTFSDVLNYSEVRTMRYTSIRPGTRTGEPHVTDLKQIRYNLNGVIEYKLSHDSGEWLQLPRAPRNIETNSFSKLYSAPLPLPKRKYQDLMDLLRVIPTEYHQFYKSLPFKKN